MSKTINKSYYKCDCGQDWGNCGLQSAFVSIYNHSIDLCEIFHLEHINSDTPIVSRLGVFTDNSFSALASLLESNSGHQPLTEQELKLIKNNKK